MRQAEPKSSKREEGRCIRSGEPANAAQCARCIFNDGTGEAVDPLVKVQRDNSGRPVAVDCLTFRARRPSEAWRNMALLNLAQGHKQ